MYRLSFMLVAICASTIVLAQNPLRTCPSDLKNNQLLQTDPVFHRSFQNMERILRQRETAPYQNDRIDGVLTIPVVVHVIHLGEAVGTLSNISDAQVQSAITALNQDFRRLPGTNGFGNGVDVELEFCLASRNPQNQSTNGIVRVNGSSVPNYATQGITANGTIGASESAVKALSTWPRASYMNIWVVSEIENNNGGAGIQGYAYFPFNSPLDGVVVQYRAFGTTGTLNSFTDMNRTLTHEVGHYLNLYHTFDNTSNCNPSGACETQGDRVCDTPPTVQNSSCSNPTCSSAQVANYMDYTPETCQNMFSAGQKLRMRTALETQRGSLLNSLGCVPVNALDVGVSAILDPVDTVCEGSLSPVVVVYNYGSQTVTSLNLNYSINGGPSNSIPWTGTINSGSTVNISLPSISLATGSQSITVFTSAPNGGLDENATNNSSSSNFFVAQGSSAIVSIILDDWGSETTWNVSGSQGVVASGGPYQNQAQGTTISERFCLATNCGVVCPSGGGTGCNYSFSVFDSFGDGQGYQVGSISLTTSSGVTTFSNNWGFTQSTNFCAPNASGTGGSSLPDANFNIQDNTVCPGTQVDFTNTSTNNPTSFSWTFEGGTPATSSASNPQNVVWSTPGTYDVTLTVANSSGSDTYVCSNCMTVYAPPTVSLTGTNPACNGQSNGSINSTVSGTGPFTYLWSNGATTANVSNLAAGSYSVTVTSSTGCSATGSATLANPALLAVTLSSVNPSCSNTSNGSISTTVSGGTGNKTYLWSPTNSVSSSISNLLAGTYSVTVTDSRGCTASASSTLTAPSAITLNYSVTNVSCSGGSNGSIIGSGSGGSGSLSYQWTPGNAITASISNLSGGNYSLLVTDGAGCTKTQSYSVTTPSAIVITGTVTNPNCPSGNGTIAVSASGGTGNKTFAWNTGQNTSTITVGAGGYFVTATDANGCTSTQSFTVTAPTALTIAANVVQPNCNGASNGSISLSLPGSVGAVTYNWGGGITGASRTGLAAGSYSVTATYGVGCTVSSSFTLTQPSALSSSITSPSNPTCNGATNGGIVVAASGGVAPYTYNWTDGVVGAVRQNLGAGTYSVNITDANGCVTPNNTTLINPPAIDVTGSVTNALCGVANGAIDVTVLNATGNVTYTWAGNVAQGSNPTGLAPGNYLLNVTDANGCSGSETFSVQTPGSMQLTADITNASCTNVPNGSIDLQVSGGTPPYTFLWNNGSIEESLVSVLSGVYSLSVQDAEGCSASGNYTVGTQYSVSISLSSLNPLCNGSSSGSANASLVGSVGAVNYQWSNGFNGAAASGLNGGIPYSVTGTDSNGCAATASVTLTSPAAIAVTSSSTPPSCGGANNGTVFFTVTGGTGAFSYLWDNGNAVVSLGIDGIPPSPVTDLAPGNYTLTASDANGCEAVREFQLIAPVQIVAEATISEVSCNGENDGAIELSLTGGNGALNVVWSNGQVGNMIDSLAAGDYTATITDASNCGVTRFYSLEEPQALVVQLSGSDPLCNAGDDGQIVSSVSGGTGAYEYEWSNGSGASNISGLAAGFYQLAVVDDNGCSAEAFLELSEPEAIVIQFDVENAQCDGSVLGSVNATFSGGTSPLSYSWDDIAGAPLNRTNLGAGLYTLNVTDANDCEASAIAAVYALSAASVDIVTFTGPSCYNGSDGAIEVSIIGGEGTQVISWLKDNVLLPGLDSTAYFNLTAGSYRVVATDALGCSAYAEVTLESPEPIAGNISIVQGISCFGGSDGSLLASATGGSGTYTFAWTGAGSSAVIDSLTAGDYELTITDEAGCFMVYNFTLSQPEALSFNPIVSDISCNGAADGSIEINANGGTAPYTYSWNSSAGSSSISNLEAGSYTMVLQDSRDCVSSTDIIISEPSPLQISTIAGPHICFGSSSGVISAIATGATPPYQYIWTGPVVLTDNSQADLFDVPAGDYGVEVMDANGCSELAEGSIIETAQLIVDANIIDATCLNPSGSGSVSLLGGTSPYSIGWYSSVGELISIDDSVDSLAPGNYTIVVSDSNDCPGLVNFSISDDAILDITIQTNNISCFGNADGSVHAILLNGLPPYQYNWSNGDSSSSISGLSQGEYSVVVTDANGCSGDAITSLTMPGLITAFIDSTSDLTCNGSADGYASIVVAGGTAPYSYLWNDELYGPIRNDLPADTFDIVVTDDMGCNVPINNVIISEPEAIAVTVDYADQSCVADNGSISLLVNGGVGPFEAIWSNGDNGLSIVNLTSGDYSAMITDANGCEFAIDQTIGTYCYETQLTGQFCSTPPASVSLLDNIQCDFVSGASSYTWFFYNSGQSLGSATSVSTLLPVSDIPGVFPGALIGVKVHVVVDGLEYTSDADCFIQIESLPTTQLIPEDCNAVISDSSYVLNCESMPDAAQYSWIIQGSSLSETVVTPGASLPISDILNLEANQSYTVTIAYTTADGFESDPGSPCTITLLINTDTSTFVNELISVGEFILFPNPGDGLTLVVRNAPEGEKMRVTDAAGRVIYVFDKIASSTVAEQRYTMPSELPQGVYFIAFDNGITRTWVVK